MFWYPSSWRRAIWLLDSVGISAPLPSAIISFSPTLPSCRHMPWHLSECPPCVDCPLLQPLLEQEVWFLHAITCLSPPSSIISSHQIGLPPFVDYVQDQGSALARSASFVNSILSIMGRIIQNPGDPRHWQWGFACGTCYGKRYKALLFRRQNDKVGVSGSWQIMESFLYVLVTLEKVCSLHTVLEFEKQL